MLAIISDDECRGDKGNKTNHTTEWGEITYYHDGCYIKYKISHDKGKTWNYEEGSEGHWVEKGWIDMISRGKNWWKLVHKKEDFFDKLNESEERRPRIGDTLYCHKPITVPMFLKNGSAISVNKPYRVVNTFGQKDHIPNGGFSITNDINKQHSFSYSKTDLAYWENWLSFFPKEIRDFNFFDKLNEQENEWFDDVVDDNQYIPKVGDVFYIPTFDYKIKVRKVVCIDGYQPKEKAQNSMNWGTETYMDYGCKIFLSSERKFYDSVPSPIQTARWEDERDSVDLGWSQILIKNGYWVKEVNINESDELEWAQDVVDAPLIKVGDVFYVVDQGTGSTPRPIDYKPDNVRYVFYVDNIWDVEYEMYVSTTPCDPHNMTYNVLDYNEGSRKCFNYNDTDNDPLTYERATELIEELYWRKL